jgi:putative effector of murein hydrolase LrgA (UPF0299 family)
VKLRGLRKFTRAWVDCSGIILTFGTDLTGKVNGLEILAGVCGGLVGLVGFVPFLLVSGAIRKRFAEQGTKVLKYALLVPLVSFVPMAVGIVICWRVAPAYLLVFAGVCIAVFLLTTVVYTALSVRGSGEKRGSA